jgi:hypothetical protein
LSAATAAYLDRAREPPGGKASGHDWQAARRGYALLAVMKKSNEYARLFSCLGPLSFGLSLASRAALRADIGAKLEHGITPRRSAVTA